jgi:catechol 2,3-dioxygenase-like lactoylglutathione lyase family enzyme
MQIEKLDHLVLTVQDLEKTCEFYANVLGMKMITFAGGRMALEFGSGKINLHRAGEEFEPKALKPTPGSADLCFITRVPLAEVVKNAHRYGLDPVEGPVKRAGAKGPIISIYLRDPDGNLIEISNRERSLT